MPARDIESILTTMLFHRLAILLWLCSTCLVTSTTTYFSQAYRHRHRHKPKPQHVKYPSLPAHIRIPQSYSVSCQQCSYAKYLPWSTGTYSHGFIHKPVGASLQQNIHLRAEDMSQILYARGDLESTPNSEISTSKYSDLYVYGNFSMTGYDVPWVKNQIRVKDHSKAWFQGAFTFRTLFHLQESEFSNLRIQTVDGFVGPGSNITVSQHSSVSIKPVRRSTLSNRPNHLKVVTLSSEDSFEDNRVNSGADTISYAGSSGNLPEAGPMGLPTFCLVQHNTLLVTQHSQLVAKGLFVMDERSNLKVSHQSALRLDRQADLILLQDSSLDIDGMAMFKVKRNTRLVVSPGVNFKAPTRSFIAIGGDMYCAIIAPIEDRYFRGAEIFIGTELDSNRYSFLICRSKSNPQSMEHALQWYLRHNPAAVSEVSAALLQN